MAAAPTELTCDLAETYGVYDLRGLPAVTLAALCAGLREESRTKMKLSGAVVRPDILLLAAIADRLGLLICCLKGAKPPQSLVDLMTAQAPSDGPVVGFDTAEEFEAARRRIIGGDS